MSNQFDHNVIRLEYESNKVKINFKNEVKFLACLLIYLSVNKRRMKNEKIIITICLS